VSNLKAGMLAFLLTVVLFAVFIVFCVYPVAMIVMLVILLIASALFGVWFIIYDSIKKNNVKN
jgi:uncharacterized membrane protein YqjE